MAHSHDKSRRHDHEGHVHDHSHSEDGHSELSHSHGVVDPSILTSERGIWAIKWSFVGLLITALFQVVVVLWPIGSVALLADTIHNFADAATAIPLWIAFALARRKPNKRFTYGYGRVEDLAGISIVAIIALSAAYAGYEAVQRLLNHSDRLLMGGCCRFDRRLFGNEAVALFRIKSARRSTVPL